MALAARLSAANRNAQLVLFGARLNDGYLRIFSGTQSVTPETGPGSSILLAELRFSNPAFGTPVNGIITAHTIIDGPVLVAGTAAWFEALGPDGTTVELTGSAGTSNANLILGSVGFLLGTSVIVDAFTHSLPMEQIVCG